MRAPTPNQKLLSRVKLFWIRVEDGLQGCGLYHSYGVNLGEKKAAENRTDGVWSYRLGLWKKTGDNSTNYYRHVVRFMETTGQMYEIIG